MRCKDCGNESKFHQTFDARVTLALLNGEVVEDYFQRCFDDDDELWECADCGSSNIEQGE